MKNNEKKMRNETDPCKDTAETIGNMAGKILDHALSLIDKRISFASENTEVLDNLSEYINSLDKEDMSRTEKNCLIQKINDLKLSKMSEITSVVSMCKDKLKADDDKEDDDKMIFVIDYGDETNEIRIKEDSDED